MVLPTMLITKLKIIYQHYKRRLQTLYKMLNYILLTNHAQENVMELNILALKSKLWDKRRHWKNIKRIHTCNLFAQYCIRIQSVTSFALSNRRFKVKVLFTLFHITRKNKHLKHAANYTTSTQLLMNSCNQVLNSAVSNISFTINGSLVDNLVQDLGTVLRPWA